MLGITWNASWFLVHFLIPFGKFGPPYLGTAAAAVRAALSSPTSACWVFLCFCNPLNSDMDHRTFNVCTWSFLCVRIHSGVGHTDNEPAQDFWLWKTLTSQIFLVLLTGFWTWSFWISSPMLYQLSYPITPTVTMGQTYNNIIYNKIITTCCSFHSESKQYTKITTCMHFRLLILDC